MSDIEWVDSYVVGTLSNGISHAVVMLSEHKDFKEICPESIKVYQIYIGRREAEQIEYYQQLLHGDFKSEEELLIRPTTIDLICESFIAFTGFVHKPGRIEVIDARIDSVVSESDNDGIFTAKLVLELELENQYCEAILDARPSDVIAITLGQRIKGAKTQLRINKAVLDAMPDIGDAQQGERTLRDVAYEIIARPTRLEG